MGSYHSTFSNFGRNGDLNAEVFRKYFIEYNEDDWLDEGGGGLQYFSDDETVTSLVILQNIKYGILLSFNCYDKKNKKTLLDFYSVGDHQKLDIIEDVGDDEYYPVGSFINPEKAWYAIEDFFKDPTQKSSRINWVDSKDIKWPEI